MVVLNRSHERIVSCLSWAGDTSPSALSDLAHTRFKIWRQNICTRKFLSTFSWYKLVPIIIYSTMKHRYCCRYPVCQNPSNLRQTGGPKNLVTEYMSKSRFVLVPLRFWLEFFDGWPNRSAIWWSDVAPSPTQKCAAVFWVTNDMLTVWRL